MHRVFSGHYDVVLIMYLMLTNRRIMSHQTRTSDLAPRASTSLLTSQLFDNGLQRFDHFIAIDARLRESQLQPEGLGGRLVAEDIGLRAARLRLGGFFPDGFASGASARDLLDQGDHFLWVALSNYL